MRVVCSVQYCTCWIYLRFLFFCTYWVYLTKITSCIVPNSTDTAAFGRTCRIIVTDVEGWLFHSGNKQCLKKWCFALKGLMIPPWGACCCDESDGIKSGTWTSARVRDYVGPLFRKRFYFNFADAASQSTLVRSCDPVTSSTLPWTPEHPGLEC